MDEANRLKVPVFVNLEHGHKYPDVLKKYADRAMFCQAVTDAAQLGGKRALIGTARKLLKSGIETAIITLAKGGCLVARGKRDCPCVRSASQSRGRVWGGGDVFRRLYLWLPQRLGPIEQSARFATAAATSQGHTRGVANVFG
jgi:sugar/nucleoside kinase (ribokinase family)